MTLNHRRTLRGCPHPFNVSVTAIAMLVATLCLASPCMATEPSPQPNSDASAGETIELPDVDLVPADYSPGVWPALASIVPGVLLHGSGVFAAGDTDAALKLLGLQGIGTLGLLGGGAVLLTTGASRRLIGPTASVLVLGFGMFTQTWFADIYGAVAGGTGGLGRTAYALADVELAGGYRFVYDPQFEYRNFVDFGATIALGDWRLEPAGTFALDDDNQQVRHMTWWRPLGPTTADVPHADGSFLDIGLGGMWHRFGTEGFSTLTIETTVMGRLDWARLAPVLEGSFSELWIGWGMQIFNYETPDLPFGEDTGELLLGGFSWGLYLADGQGDVRVFYDHRHDGFAAGLGTTGLGGGIAGHFGLDGHYVFGSADGGPGWGLGAEFLVGSAYVTAIDVFYRWGRESGASP